MSFHETKHSGAGRCKQCPAMRHSVCGSVDERALRELGLSSRTRLMAADETVLIAGNDAAVVGILRVGIVRVVGTLPDGRHQVVGLLYPGELVGLPILGQSAFAYECATEVEICVFERSRFDKIVRQTPEMLQELYMSALADGNMMRERMMLCASQSTLERIATYLLMMLDRREVQMERLNLISQKKVAVSAISRRDLASYLGTTIESISRNIHTLASRGIVRIIDSSHFEVLDRPALLSLSGVAEDDLSLLRHGPKARVPASTAVSPTSSTAVAPV